MKAGTLARMIRHLETDRDRLVGLLADLDGKIANLEGCRNHIDQTLEQEINTGLNMEGGFGVLSIYMTGIPKKKRAIAQEVQVLNAGRTPLLDAIMQKQIEIKRLEKLGKRIKARADLKVARAETRDIEEAAMVCFNRARS